MLEVSDKKTQKIFPVNGNHRDRSFFTERTHEYTSLKLKVFDDKVNETKW